MKWFIQNFDSKGYPCGGSDGGWFVPVEYKTVRNFLKFAFNPWMEQTRKNKLNPAKRITAYVYTRPFAEETYQEVFSVDL